MDRLSRRDVLNVVAKGALVDRTCGREVTLVRPFESTAIRVKTETA